MIPTNDIALAISPLFFLCTCFLKDATRSKSKEVFGLLLIYVFSYRNVDIDLSLRCWESDTLLLQTPGHLWKEIKNFTTQKYHLQTLENKKAEPQKMEVWKMNVPFRLGDFQVPAVRFQRITSDSLNLVFDQGSWGGCTPARLPRHKRESLKLFLGERSVWSDTPKELGIYILANRFLHIDKDRIRYM